MPHEYSEGDFLYFHGFAQRRLFQNLLDLHQHFMGPSMIPSSRNRVALHTASKDNRAIAAATAARLEHFAENPSEIEARLRELDQEWDIERAIEMNASALAFAGVAGAALHDKRWLILPALVTGFLFQHAVQGWCPPVPVLRKMGFRTVYEIEQERYALKALRGDFRSIGRRNSGKRRTHSVRRKASPAQKAA